MTKDQIIQLFESEALSVSDKKNENEIQKFLEFNTELIPLPFLLNHGVHTISFFQNLISQKV